MADSKYKKQTEWKEKNTTRVYIRLNNHTDGDILEWIGTLPNKQGYIKELIRKDMKTNK